MFEPKDKRDMFLLADRLNRHILILERLSKKVWFCLILSFCMSLCSSSLAVVLICCYSKFNITLYLLVFCLILSILLFSRLRQLKRKAREKYQYCKKLSYLIADMVDWRVFRKRQLHSPLYFRIQNPLDKYFLFCDSYWCLFERGKLVYDIFYYMNCSAIVVMMLYFVIIMINFLK